jgi:hypothetical protein
MEVLLQFTGLVIATVFAAAAAVALHWLFLRGAFRLMQPATARQAQPVRSELVRGTREAIRHLAPQR